MLSSKNLLRIASLLRLLAWLTNLADWSEIENLCQKCENEARQRAIEEQIEEPEWLKRAPWNDFE